MNTTKSELTPEHVDRLNTFAQLKADGFIGSDASLRISLHEYGLAWRYTPDGILFLYRIRGDGEASRFDRHVLPPMTDPRKEWDWVKWGDVAATCGMSVDGFLARPLEAVVGDLLGYYGSENVFGTSYGTGFQIR
jgi:hypothetical protein